MKRTLKDYVPKQRTANQNRAMHLFFTLLAQSLNDAGLDQRKVLKPSINIPWTPEAIKEQIWKPIQQVMFNKKSTTQLFKLEEIEKIHAVITRELGEKHHVEYIPFPSVCSECKHIDCLCEFKSNPLPTNYRRVTA